MHLSGQKNRFASWERNSNFTPFYFILYFTDTLVDKNVIGLLPRNVTLISHLYNYFFYFTDTL